MHFKVNSLQSHKLILNLWKMRAETLQNGDILKELRKDHKLTQAELAEKLKITRQYYSDYECEKFELPLHHLEFLADFFGVSADFILGRTSVSTPYPKRGKNNL